MFSVYKITNNINNKCYIGSSIRVEKRWKQHINNSNNPNSNSYNYPLQRAFRKYGINNFSFEILKDDFENEKEMQDYEKEMILYYASYTNKGYNQTIQTNQTEIAKENLQKHLETIRQKCAKVDLNENIIEIYSSYHEAAKYNGFYNCPENGASTIRQVCKGITSSANSLIFRDLDNNGNVYFSAN